MIIDTEKCVNKRIMYVIESQIVCQTSHTHFARPGALHTFSWLSEIVMISLGGKSPVLLQRGKT